MIFCSKGEVVRYEQRAALWRESVSYTHLFRLEVLSDVTSMFCVHLHNTYYTFMRLCVKKNKIKIVEMCTETKRLFGNAYIGYRITSHETFLHSPI